MITGYHAKLFAHELSTGGILLPIPKNLQERFWMLRST